ncbi:MAG: LuxR family transcriptional regulator [Pseudonocardiales bacterium]|nr:LuxR family transcriptional regulator [Pseudonocardiales bacterium]
MPTEKIVRLLVCEDHLILADALAVMIGMDSGLKLVAAPVQTGQRAIDEVVRHRPDVVLMDVELSGEMTGFQACSRIRDLVPSTKVVIMSGTSDVDSAIVDSIEAGASGFLSKVESAATILAATRAAAQGEALIDAMTLARVLHRIAQDRNAQRGARERAGQLTGREREILQYFAQGRSNSDIAARLFISPHTVQSHTRNILAKLGVHSKLQAVAYATKAGAIAA